MGLDRVVYHLYTFADYDWVFHEEYIKLKEAEEDAARLPSYAEWKILRVESKTINYNKPGKPVYV